jgi:hypothetical protein
MGGIFLSYRRDDASGWAGRLYEHLLREWEPDHVFMDIDTIPPGDDFREAIARTMRTCDVVIVMIGPNWLSAQDRAGNRRLDDESDTHRAEVAAALTADVRVIPVLVGGAAMPRVSELPEPLKELAYRNAAVLEDRRFATDLGALQSTLKQFVDIGGSRGAADESVPPDKADDRRDSRVLPPRSESTGADAQGSGTESSRTTAGTFLMSSTALAVTGMALVSIWGVLVQREWHNEYWAYRVGAGLLILALAGIGLWSKQWKWVLGAGVAGLLGLALWMLQLLSTHSDEVNDLFSLDADGIPNFVTFAGALLVLLAGLIGMRTRPTK